MQLLSLIQCPTPDEASEVFSLLTPLHSLLDFLGGRAYSALPCAGAPPPQRPLSCPRRSKCVANLKLSSRGGRAYPPPRVLAGTEYVAAQARQAKQLPYMPNVHRYDYSEPPTEILTVHFPQTDRTQYTHRTWLGSYEEMWLCIGSTPKRSYPGSVVF